MRPIALAAGSSGLIAICFYMLATTKMKFHDAESQAKVLNSFTDMIIGERIGDLMIAAATPMLQDEAYKNEAAQKITVNYRNSSSIYSSVSILSADAEVLADANRHGLGAPYAMKLPVGWQDGAMHVEYIQGLYGIGDIVFTQGIGRTSPFKRFFVFRVSAQNLAAVLSLGDVDAQLGSDEYSLVDRSGRVLFSSRGSTTAVELPQQALALQPGQVSYHFDFGGVLISSRSSGDVRYSGDPWLVIIRLPVYNLVLPLILAAVATALLFAMLIALSTWVAKITAEEVSGPVLAMIKAVAAIQEGRFDVAAALPTFEDELGELAHGVWITAAALDANQAKLLERQAELTSARDLALAASQAKSRFLANMSHEIRTPLNGIIGFAETLDEGLLTPEQKSVTAMMVESGHILLSVINDILDVSKIESGKMTIEEVDFSIISLAESTFMLFTRQYEKKGIRLRLEVSISETAQWLRGDPVRIKQIFINLLSNALKFSGNNDVFWRLSLQSEDDRWLILIGEVEDHGVGMSQDQVRKLFAPFVQADSSTTRKYGGTGLGLSIVRSLAELMHGEADVESIAGEGSKFTVRIPLKAGVANVAGMKSGAATSDQLAAIKMLRVLVVEDNLINQKVAVAIFKKFGLTIMIAENGAVGVEALNTGTFDVVFMDLQMPVMDGLTASAKIRDLYQATQRSLPVMAAMTANVFGEDRQHCFDAGLSEFVAKPIRAADVERVLLLATLARKAA